MPLHERHRTAQRNGSASRSNGWRTRRWSPAAAASPATSTSRASFTCGSCASNHAHANIVSIDTEAARALPGVVAVWTAADIADVPPIDFREGRSRSSRRTASRCWRRQGALRRRAGCGGVRRGPYVAEDAADLVTMEVEELPPLLDARDDPASSRSAATPKPRL
jgi:CO/xanthine dehydrogenase Mo-binding subunit